jgi:hypothetical protein
VDLHNICPCNDLSTTTSAATTQKNSVTVQKICIATEKPFYFVSKINGSVLVDVQSQRAVLPLANIHVPSYCYICKTICKHVTKQSRSEVTGFRAHTMRAWRGLCLPRILAVRHETPCLHSQIHSNTSCKLLHRLQGEPAFSQQSPGSSRHQSCIRPPYHSHLHLDSPLIQRPHSLLSKRARRNV